MAFVWRYGVCSLCWWHDAMIVCTRNDNNMLLQSQIIQPSVISLYTFISAFRQKEPTGDTHSAGAFRRYQSIAPENTANAAPPPSIALGPEFRASTAPARNPAVTPLAISFFARYCECQSAEIFRYPCRNSKGNAVFVI